MKFNQPKQPSPKPNALSRRVAVPPPAAAIQPKKTPVVPPVYRPVPSAAPRSRAIQRFAVSNGPAAGNYNSLQTLTPLIAEVMKDATFATKRKHVEYWLRQYVSTYGADNFKFDELKDYLYDDIIRDARAIKASADMGAQELVTTAAGWRRLAENRQAFPAAADVRFYRTMGTAELKSLLRGTIADVDESRWPRRGEVFKFRGADKRAFVANSGQLGAHVGDYKQARSYYSGANQALVEFTLPIGTLFTRDSLALPRTVGAGNPFRHVTGTLRARDTGAWKEASAGEGTHAEVPGLKSEDRGLYSVGLSAGGAAVFLGQVKQIKIIEISVA